MSANFNQALEGKFVGCTEGDNGYLVYVFNTSKVVANGDVIIKEFEVGSIPDNTETPDLPGEGYRNWSSGTQMTINKTMARKRNRAHLLQYERSGMMQRVLTIEKRH